MNTHNPFQGLGWSSNPFTFRIQPKLFIGYDSVIQESVDRVLGGDKTLLLLGATGSGKTTFLMHLWDIIDRKYNTKNLIFLPKPPKDPQDWVGVFKEYTKTGFFSRLFRNNGGVDLYNLSDRVNTKLRGQKCILFIDEVHEATTESLEWLRTLTDQITNLSVIMAGLPVFESSLKSNLETLNRRITKRFELRNLSKAETFEFIKKRIEAHGGSDIHPFTYSTVETVYEKTGGFPREIIRLCNEMAHKSLEKNLTTIDMNLLHDIEMDETPIKEPTEELPERQKLILETLMKQGELSPSQIIKVIKVTDYKNKDNAVRSVNNLLNRLMAQKMVERKRVGKTYKYQITGKYKTMMVTA